MSTTRLIADIGASLCRYLSLMEHTYVRLSTENNVGKTVF